MLMYGICALPALAMLFGLISGQATADMLLHGSGELSARFMLVALAVSPLSLMWPGRRWVEWLRVRRRALGILAFGYAALHTLLYAVDMGALDSMLAELSAIGIWTGWLALVIFIPLAATSNNYSVTWLNRNWQYLHRLVYPAALLVLLHWVYVHNNVAAAAVHFFPLILLEAIRAKKLLWR